METPVGGMTGAPVHSQGASGPTGGGVGLTIILYCRYNANTRMAGRLFARTNRQLVADPGIASNAWARKLGPGWIGLRETAPDGLSFLPALVKPG